MQGLRNTHVIGWGIPTIVAMGIFVAARPVFAQIVERQANVAQYLTANDVGVGEEVQGGFSRIYYFFNGSRTFVSQENLNSTHAHAKGEYIVWSTEMNGAGQIFLYHIPTQSLTQLTSSSTNLQPKVDRSGKVVWERWVKDRWQIFLFDGKSVQQITDGDVSFNADIEGDTIVFSRQDVSRTYRAVLYSIGRREFKDIAGGIPARKPIVRDGKIYLAGTGIEVTFPSTVNDLFSSRSASFTATPSASPASLPVPQAVSEKEIVQELRATSSAEIFGTPSFTATSSASSSSSVETFEASPSGQNK